ncbi:MAG: hypothetical protein WCE21_01885 [Candidatus Babeliales bacterium]
MKKTLFYIALLSTTSPALIGSDNAQAPLSSAYDIALTKRVNFMCGLCERGTGNAWCPNASTCWAHKECDDWVKQFYRDTLNTKTLHRPKNQIDKAHETLLTHVRAQCNMPITQYAEKKGMENLRDIFIQSLATLIIE